MVIDYAFHCLNGLKRAGISTRFNRRQLVELTVFRAQVGEEGFDVHRSTSRTLDKFMWLKLAPMLIEVFAQPGV